MIKRKFPFMLFVKIKRINAELGMVALAYISATREAEEGVL
jgi:hypothetical protein